MMGNARHVKLNDLRHSSLPMLAILYCIASNVQVVNYFYLASRFCYIVNCKTYFRIDLNNLTISKPSKAKFPEMVFGDIPIHIAFETPVIFDK